MIVMTFTDDMLLVLYRRFAIDTSFTRTLLTYADIGLFSLAQHPWQRLLMTPWERFPLQPWPKAIELTSRIRLYQFR